MARPRYFDIGVNFTDPMFHGRYHDRHCHPGDIEDVVLRAKTFNVRKMLLTGSSLEESRKTLEIATAMPDYLYTTVGVHPCSAKEITEENETKYLSDLKELALSGKRTGFVKAFGEIGLDYDRLYHTPADIQKKYFQKQLDVAVEVGLPLFLHSRACHADFVEILKPYLPRLPKGGVVHSFTGTKEELDDYLALGLYVSVNGCSLKTEENLEVLKHIPLDRLLVETDAPWCEIRPTHAGYKYLTAYPNETYPSVLTKQSSLVKVVDYREELARKSSDKGLKLDPLLPFPLLKKDQYSKYDAATRTLTGTLASPMIKGRNEPVKIGHVVEIVAKVRGEPIEQVIEQTYENSIRLFEIDRDDDEFFDY